MERSLAKLGRTSLLEWFQNSPPISGVNQARHVLSSGPSRRGAGDQPSIAAILHRRGRRGFVPGCHADAHTIHGMGSFSVLVRLRRSLGRMVAENGSERRGVGRGRL